MSAVEKARKEEARMALMKKHKSSFLKLFLVWGENFSIAFAFFCTHIVRVYLLLLLSVVTRLFGESKVTKKIQYFVYALRTKRRSEKEKEIFIYIFKSTSIIG